MRKIMTNSCKVKIIIGGNITANHVRIIATTIAEENHRSVEEIVSEIECAAEKMKPTV